MSVGVISAIAERRGVEPTTLPPLYEWIDPDALDALFEPTRSGRRGGRISFTYDGHDVVIDCDDGLEIAVDGTPVTEIEPAAPAVESADGSRSGV